MTVQVADALFLRGRRYPLCNTPLEGYLRGLRKAQRPAFSLTSTACWRGYVASWEIRGAALYLLDIDGWIERDGRPRKAGIKDALPWLAPPVKAFWVTDELRCPEGRQISSRHGFASDYERDRLIHIEQGCVREEWLRKNPPEPEWYRIDADGRQTRMDERSYEASKARYKSSAPPPPAEPEDDEIAAELPGWPPPA